MLRATSVPLLSNEYTTATVASGSAVGLTTATTANVTSLVSLPAGTYLLWGNVDYTLTSATVTLAQCAVSVTSATLPTQAGGSGLGTDPLSIIIMSTTTLSASMTLDCGPTKLVIAVATTVFLVAQATFSAGTVAAYGTINALQLNLV